MESTAGDEGAINLGWLNKIPDGHEDGMAMKGHGEEI
jgi:hypothetical protein